MSLQIRFWYDWPPFQGAYPRALNSVAKATVHIYGYRPCCHGDNGNLFLTTRRCCTATVITVHVTMLCSISDSSHMLILFSVCPLCVHPLGWRPLAWSWPWRESDCARLGTLKGEQRFLRQPCRSAQKTWRPSVPFTASWAMPTSTSRNMAKPWNTTNMTLLWPGEHCTFFNSF